MGELELWRNVCLTEKSLMKHIFFYGHVFLAIDTNYFGTFFFYGHVFLAIDTSYFETFFFYGHVSFAVNKSYCVY